VSLIAGMAKALELWQLEADSRTVQIKTMRDRLQTVLEQDAGPVVVHGRDTDRLPNTLSISFPGVAGEALLMNLHLAGIACSLGSTCASGSAEPAPALLAMGVAPDVCKSTVRFSLSCHNTPEEIEYAMATITKIVHRMRSETGE
jgi:cysteine desulfurase